MKDRPKRMRLLAMLRNPTIRRTPFPTARPFSPSAAAVAAAAGRHATLSRFRPLLTAMARMKRAHPPPMPQEATFRRAGCRKVLQRVSTPTPAAGVGVTGLRAKQALWTRRQAVKAKAGPNGLLTRLPETGRRHPGGHAWMDRAIPGQGGRGHETENRQAPLRERRVR